jgi:hypothetical protein
MNIPMMMSKEKFESMTIEVNTPDGLLYCTICEKDNKIVKIISTFGKAGNSLAAWSNAVDILVNLLLQQGLDVNDIISELSLISASKPMISPNTGTKVASGPAGIVIALLEYKRQKYQEANLKMLTEGY